MLKTSNLNIRIEKSLKNSAETIFAKLGITTTSAINMFLRQTVLQRGIPFDIRIPKTPEQIDKEWENKPHIPNKRTLQAMKEVEQMIADKKAGKKVVSYATPEEAFKALGL